MKDISNGTVGGALAFLTALVEKGRLSENQAKPLKIAITKVFSVVDGETWEQTNVRGADIDDYMARFVNKTTVFYTEQSLQAYKSRIVRALKWYEHFLDNPGQTPNIQGGRARPEKRASSEKKIAKKDSTPEKNRPVDQTTTPASAPPNTELITYPFPLAVGQIARLSLPISLTKGEAKRLAVFIESLVLEEPEKGDSM